ncbi:MAG: CheR family methyltransferase [Spirochaetia bacterium]
METGTRKKRRRMSYRDNENENEHAAIIDFKMVTFSLGGKDYGIDIMKVSEIAKFEKYTYVPNTLPFVTGVYNLRSDIISLIDLRKMFNLPIPEKNSDGAENGLILRLDNNMIGIIVDSIDKVVGISSESIQPPHPIFGDINIKYISGVVENDSRLYIILDVEKIFQKDEAPPAHHEPVKGISDSSPVELGELEPYDSTAPSDLTFVKETLKTFSSFYTTPINEQWVEARFSEWSEKRQEQKRSVQLKSKEDGEAFLAPFYSPFSGTFWNDEYIDKFFSLETSGSASNGPVFIWNPGCGQGYEAYSVTAGFLKRNPEAKLKVWASDNDLLAISNAPNLVISGEGMPDYLSPFVAENKNGFTLGEELKDRILFEYHDVLHANTVPEVDIILCRDLLSFLKPEDQMKIIEEFAEKLKSGGILCIGNNEQAPLEGMERVNNSSFSAYRKL